ncbi:hypothetical protein DUI87_15127 [Hirundo rustica rustica]|uniref:Uncharacterized protein n=1 Tax=Hirundo rustica rustica TaxID=333673 RepID=A0A3M0K4K4_HIRRU|nr:hypothetical protein DUI87_15127 [Hirundo rustica rustica]
MVPDKNLLQKKRLRREQWHWHLGRSNSPHYKVTGIPVEVVSKKNLATEPLCQVCIVIEMVLQEIGVYSALQEDVVSSSIPKDLQSGKGQRRREILKGLCKENPGVKDSYLSQGQARTFLFVPEMWWRNRTGAGWLVATLQLVDDERKSAASGLDTDL